MAPSPDISPVQDESTEFTSTSRFRFDCHGDLPCFTHCCRDVNIFLTPYDVLRMRRALRMGSREFLDRYTRHFLAKTTHIPVVQLAMAPQTLSCQLVTDNGCAVYEHRPWACRMYPLDLAGHPDRFCLIAHRQRCLGLGEPRTWAVGEWLESQGVAPYEVMERSYQAVMPARFRRGQPMETGLGKIMFLAYDLDQFARLLDDRSFRSLYGIDEAMLVRLATNDEEMLRLAFRYIRHQLEDLLEYV
jgi:Fe-S-cluster containining protein